MVKSDLSFMKNTGQLTDPHWK